MIGKHHLIALTFLGFCVSLLPSCGPPGGGSALQAYAPVAPKPPGTARVWFLHTNDPQEQAGGSWLQGAAGGATYYVRTLPPDLDQAYLRMLTDKGPPRAI